MGLRDLIARLTLDTKGFAQGLNQAEKLTGKWAAKQEKFVAGSLFKTFSLAGWLHTLNDQAKEAKAVLIEANKTGLSPERFLQFKKASEELGQSVEFLVENFNQLPKAIQETINEMPKVGKTTTLLAESGTNLEGIARGAAVVGAGAAKILDIGANYVIAAILNAIPFAGGLRDRALDELKSEMGDFYGEEPATERRLKQRLTSATARKSSRDNASMESFLRDDIGKEFLQQTSGYTSDFQSINRNVNSLQSIGAGIGGSDQMTVEIRKQVQLLESVDGTLKEIHEEKQFTVDPLQ